MYTLRFRGIILAFHLTIICTINNSSEKCVRPGLNINLYWPEWHSPTFGILSRLTQMQIDPKIRILSTLNLHLLFSTKVSHHKPLLRRPCVYTYLLGI